MRQKEETKRDDRSFDEEEEEWVKRDNGRGGRRKTDGEKRKKVTINTGKEQNVVTDWEHDGEKNRDENTVQMKLTINASMDVG